MTQPPRCPDCGTQARPILRGYPAPEAFEASERGEIRLGGCLIWDGASDCWCPECDLEFLSAPEASRDKPAEDPRHEH